MWAHKLEGDLHEAFDCFTRQAAKDNLNSKTVELLIKEVLDRTQCVQIFSWPHTASVIIWSRKAVTAAVKAAAATSAEPIKSGLINIEISGNLSILRRSIFRGVYKTLKVAFSLAPALFLENGLDIGKDFILSDGDVNSRQFPMKVKILILETFFDNQSFYERWQAMFVFQDVLFDVHCHHEME